MRWRGCGAGGVVADLWCGLGYRVCGAEGVIAHVVILEKIIYNKWNQEVYENPRN